MRVDINALAVQLSMKDINALLKKKEKSLQKVEQLKERKAKLLARLSDIESQLEALEGEVSSPVPASEAAPGRKRRASTGRRKGGQTYKELVHEYLASVGGEVNLTEIVGYVIKKRTGSDSPTQPQYTAVSTVIRSDSAVARVGRGLYQLVGKAAAPAPEEKAPKKATKKAAKKAGKKAAAAKAAKPGPVQIAYEFLKEKGGEVSAKALIAKVAGRKKGRNPQGIIMAIGRDKRFTRPTKDTYALA